MLQAIFLGHRVLHLFLDVLQYHWNYAAECGMFYV